MGTESHYDNLRFTQKILWALISEIIFRIINLLILLFMIILVFQLFNLRHYKMLISKIIINETNI